MPQLTDRYYARRCALFLAGALVFALAYTQAPLYYSNQNQYFLHGLAAAEVGQLPEDWLANTLDPTPVFSALVAWTVRLTHPWAFHLYYALLQGAYAAALVGLFAAVVGSDLARNRWPVFVALLVLVHAAVVRWCSYRWLGLDCPWYFQAGLAGQYALGAMFQPSTFGTLLVVSACLFVRGHIWLAVVVAALSATIHTTYLLHAGFLTAAYLSSLLYERRPGQALWAGSLALFLVLPVTIYAVTTFRPGEAEAFAAAQDVLVNFRIPHHCRPDLWLDVVAGLQIAWMVLAMILARPARLFFVLFIPFVLGLLLTGAQLASGSNTLALLFPWRISVVLVPMASGVILSRLAAIPWLPLEGAKIKAMAALLVIGLAAAGVWLSAARMGFRTSDDELPLFEFVRHNQAPGQLYFLPVNVPNLAAATRGSFSSDFKPLPEKKRDPRLIPIDLQRFRLHAGMPIFVDFKSIPYKDAEVLAWRRRIDLAQKVQDQLNKGQLEGAIDRLRSLRVTHLVRQQGQELSTPSLRPVFAGGGYLVYRLEASP